MKKQVQGYRQMNDKWKCFVVLGHTLLARQLRSNRCFNVLVDFTHSTTAQVEYRQVPNS